MNVQILCILYYRLSVDSRVQVQRGSESEQDIPVRPELMFHVLGVYGCPIWLSDRGSIPHI